MLKEIKLIIENKLVLEKRDLNVYCHAARSSHIISFNSSITLPLKSYEENDYLYLSPISGPGDTKNGCTVSLPFWIDFEFYNLSTNITLSRLQNILLLHLPPGFSGWELKLTHMNFPFYKLPNRITIIENLQEF